MGTFDLTAGYKSLSADINKYDGVSAKPEEQGLGAKVPELSLSMPDDEIVKLTRQWEAEYFGYSKEIAKIQDDCLKYWLGRHYDMVEFRDGKRPLVDNLIFEALETFLPEATKKNPEPVVTSDATQEGLILSKRVKGMLAFLADELKLKLKIKSIARHWALSLLGVGKISWNLQENEISVTPLAPQKLILDKDATIDEAGNYTGGYIGEYQSKTADEMVKIFPKKKDFITKLVEGKMGTKITYIEWWTPEALFYTYKTEVLEKFKNPNWNYDTIRTIINYDEYGNQQPFQTVTPGVNHFLTPKMPYVFLSVFNLGKRPHDETSLVYQNLANQDEINTINRQIIKNVKGMNNGIAVSGDAFTKEQAALAADELEDGGALWIPKGKIGDAFARATASALPADVYNTRNDTRQELRNIFGVRGSSAQGVASEQTVRGKIIIGQKDSSRIGGGVSEYIEQTADQIYNWFIQMMYVYYTEPHYASVLGENNAQELITLRNTDLNRRLKVTVKEGSMIPKDDLTEANQAIDLYQAGALDPITLFSKLDFPDPKASAEQLFIWQRAPDLLFPEAAAKIAQMQQGQQQNKPPSTSISFKDLPPEGQSQLAQQAGIQINPLQVAMNQAVKESQKHPTTESPPQGRSLLDTIQIK